MSDNLKEKKTGVLQCDMCPADHPSPARKTCMKCEISMCVQHLQAHLTTPVLLQTHPLTEPIALAGDAGTKCPQHGKLLEYYCLDDLVNVCVSCAIEGQHRLHDMKTLPTAHEELLQRLATEQKALANTEKGKLSLETWDRSERDKLQRSATRLIEAVSSLRDLAQTRVQSSVAARLLAIKTAKSSVEAAKREEDAFRFLQLYSQVYQDVQKAKAVDLGNGLEPGSERNKLLRELQQGGQTMIQQATQLLDSTLTLVNPKNPTSNQDAPDFNSQLTFDPQSLAAPVSLSKDRKKVFCHSWEGNFPNCNVLIQMPHTDSDTIRWTLSLPMQFDWTIGLCAKNVTGYLANNLSYIQTHGDISALGWLGNQLTPVMSSHTSSQTRLACASDACRPQKVEVVWNVSKASLSFLNQCDRTEILKIPLRSPSREYAPFLKVDDSAHSNAFTSGFGFPRQNRCRCGRSRSAGAFGNNYCSCGQMTDKFRTTELLCELL
ncbi:E3 ubiquitin/ISG15 ligase TRIM25 [Lampris incognitus]|uniref:E3 ubiquitin/ISG15 ligase TRIM25 n=1 Tax=Lampris incognitus TaxID=2546036 RepID=UPI0024B62D40|nr:E3 ubiquitin/ISG15 ligase TRIM25 [Lampris incognitus]